MQTENNFFDELKHQYKYGGMTIRLILINLAVFLLIGITEVLARLLGGTAGVYISYFTNQTFTLQTDGWAFITHPWGLFTSIFAHYGFFHLLWNMVFLYFSGKMFEQVFDQKRMLYTYILGGLFGGLLEVLAHLVFPGLADNSTGVIGASGSVMAILIALAFHKPKMVVSLFGFFNIRLIFLALFFILKDLLALGANDGVAHFAHFGGAILGILSIQNIYSSSNIVNVTHRIGDKIVRFFSIIFNPTKTPKMKVAKGGARTQQFKSDEAFNVEKKERQQKTDRILDKISKSGYESLSKDEKDFLFRQSNKS